MERCRWCRSTDLDSIEYVEESLFGETIRVLVVYCQTCGQAETVQSNLTPARV